MTALSFLAAVILGSIHLFASKLMFIRHGPRDWWLSFAGGTSVAYVFVHLFPEIRIRESADSDNSATIAGWLQSNTHLLALFGITVYYAMERWARTTREREQDKLGNASDKSCAHVFWLHIASFAIYVAAVGYLLHGEHFRPDSLSLFTIALGLHFIVNDYGLQELHNDTYHNKGRYILAVAPIVGWIIGWLNLLPEHILTAVVAFLAGGIILNVLKEELPSEREARIIPFVLGVAIYAGLLLAVE